MGALSDLLRTGSSLADTALPLYTITGYTATLPDDPDTGTVQVAVANYADVAAFEAAVVPVYSGQRCQVAGWPHASTNTSLEATALSTGGFKWAPLWQAKTKARPLDPREFGVVPDDTTDVTVPLRHLVAAAPAGGTIDLPSYGDTDRYRITGKIDITKALTFSGGGVVFPDPPDDATTAIFEVAADDVTFDGIGFDGTGKTGAIAQSMRLISAIAANNRLTVNRVSFTNMVGGYSDDATDLKGVHGVYINGGKGSLVERCRWDSVMGAAVYFQSTEALKVRYNDVGPTGWYGVHAATDNSGYEIVGNEFWSDDDTLDRYWGGSLDLMSQHSLSLPPDKWIMVAENNFSGPHSYGAVVRLLSLHQCRFNDNFFQGCYATAPSSDPLSIVRVTPRGVSGDDHNGPWSDIIAQGNQMIAGEAAQRPFYIDGAVAGFTNIDESGPILIDHLTAKSLDSTHYFAGVYCLAGVGGVRGFSVTNSRIHGKPDASAVNGAGGGMVGAAGTSTASVNGVRVKDNDITFLTPDTTGTETHHTGISMGAYVDYWQATGNHIRRMRYGVRVDDANLGTNTIGTPATDNLFENCTTAVLT